MVFSRPTGQPAVSASYLSIGVLGLQVHITTDCFLWILGIFKLSSYSFFVPFIYISMPFISLIPLCLPSALALATAPKKEFELKLREN